MKRAMNKMKARKDGGAWMTEPTKVKPRRCVGACGIAVGWTNAADLEVDIPAGLTKQAYEVSHNETTQC